MQPNNVIYEEAVMKIREDVATGQQPNLRCVPIVFHHGGQMVAIGEESGALMYAR